VLQVECARGSLNQIPPHASFSGDIRLVPFYEIKDVKAKVERYEGRERGFGEAILFFSLYIFSALLL
jgi:acetylornithine deacetylase/succinyl-diaminopimelate desuccinylase-like protein